MPKIKKQESDQQFVWAPSTCYTVKSQHAKDKLCHLVIERGMNIDSAANLLKFNLSTAKKIISNFHALPDWEKFLVLLSGKTPKKNKNQPYGRLKRRRKFLKEKPSKIPKKRGRRPKNKNTILKEEPQNTVLKQQPILFGEQDENHTLNQGQIKRQIDNNLIIFPFLVVYSPVTQQAQKSAIKQEPK